MFVTEGTHAIAWEFQQGELSAEFTASFWKLLLRNDDMSAVLMRFIWNLPLRLKRTFVRALDRHLSERYPMFAGLSQGWPSHNGIAPYVRPAHERALDFGLVNQGYLGYAGLGYGPREIELFVWLEALRDKQCEDRPCEVGVAVEGKAENSGGCPVKIHIPEMLELLGSGKFKAALS